MLIPYVLMLLRLDATLDSLPNVKKYAETVKARRLSRPSSNLQAPWSCPKRCADQLCYFLLLHCTRYIFLRLAINCKKRAVAACPCEGHAPDVPLLRVLQRVQVLRAPCMQGMHHAPP